MQPSPPKSRVDDGGVAHPPVRRQLSVPIPCPELDRSAISDELTQDTKNALVELNQIESPSVATTTPGATTMHQQSITGTTTAASICSYDTPHLQSSIYGGTFFAAARVSPIRRSCTFNNIVHHHDSGVAATIPVDAPSSPEDRPRQRRSVEAALEMGSPPMDLHRTSSVTFANMSGGHARLPSAPHLVLPQPPTLQLPPLSHRRPSSSISNTRSDESLEDGAASIEAPALTACPSGGSYSAQMAHGRDRTAPPSEASQLFGLDSPYPSSYSRHAVFGQEPSNARSSVLARSSVSPPFSRTNVVPYAMEMLVPEYVDDTDVWINPEDGIQTPRNATTQNDAHHHPQQLIHLLPNQSNSIINNGSSRNGTLRLIRSTPAESTISERRSNNISSNTNNISSNTNNTSSNRCNDSIQITRPSAASQTTGSCMCCASYRGRSCLLSSAAHGSTPVQIQDDVVSCAREDRLAWRMEPASSPNPQRSRAAHNAVLEMLATIV